MRELSNTIGQLQAREQELLTKLKLKVSSFFLGIATKSEHFGAILCFCGGGGNGALKSAKAFESRSFPTNNY